MGRNQLFGPTGQPFLIARQNVVERDSGILPVVGRLAGDHKKRIAPRVFESDPLDGPFHKYP